MKFKPRSRLGSQRRNTLGLIACLNKIQGQGAYHSYDSNGLRALPF